MAPVAKGNGKKGKGAQPAPMRRVSPLKPGLQGASRHAQIWATAKMREASYSWRGFMRVMGSVTLVFIFILTLGLWVGGFMPDVKQASTEFTQGRLMDMGFVVKRVDITGEGRLNENDIRQSLGVSSGDYIFGIDLRSAQKRVESLSWVDHAVVRRLWPNRIVVQVVERRPFALWQHDSKIQVVDASGTVITDANPVTYAELPRFIGDQAAVQAAAIYDTVAAYPVLADRVETWVYVEERRWDILMNEGALRVALPAQGLSRALDQLSDLQASQRIFDRDIALIDMRIAGRLALRTSSPPSATSA